jgi:hypothetical protein
MTVIPCRVSIAPAYAQPFCIGIYVHERSYYVVIRTADPEGFVEQIHRLSIPVYAVAYEAGPTRFGLARMLRSASIETLMAAPSRILEQ